MDIRIEIKKYLDYCKYRKELSNNTLRAYHIDLEQYGEYVKVLVPDKVLINQYVTELHKSYKQKTVKRKIASIKAFYNYLEEEEILSFNPLYKIKVKFRENVTLPKIIARDVIETLLNHMYSIANSLSTPDDIVIKNIAVIELLFATGIRVSELSNIKPEDINLSTGTIKIVGKGSKERYVQIGNVDVLKILNDYYSRNKERIESSGYFFINKVGKRYTEQSIRKMIQKYTKEAGIKTHITPHMFRHSFATYLIEEGADISYVQKILGHSSIRTTQIYLHVSTEKQAEVLRTLHPRNRMKILVA